MCVSPLPMFASTCFSSKTEYPRQYHHQYPYQSPHQYPPSSLLVSARLAKLRNEEDLESTQLKSTACALTKILVSVCKNNFVNQMLLFCHQDLLSALFFASLGVVDAYTEMIRNNKQLIQEISAEDVQDIFDNLRQQQVHDHCGGRFVMLLPMSCQCNGVPVPADQNFVLNCFLLGHTELLLRTKVYSHDCFPLSSSLPSFPPSLPLCLLTATPCSLAYVFNAAYSLCVPQTCCYRWQCTYGW